MTELSMKPLELIRNKRTGKYMIRNIQLKSTWTGWNVGINKNPDKCRFMLGCPSLVQYHTFNFYLISNWTINFIQMLLYYFKYFTTKLPLLELRYYKLLCSIFIQGLSIKSQNFSLVRVQDCFFIILEDFIMCEYFFSLLTLHSVVSEQVIVPKTMMKLQAITLLTLIKGADEVEGETCQKSSG